MSVTNFLHDLILHLGEEQTPDQETGFRSRPVQVGSVA